MIQLVLAVLFSGVLIFATWMIDVRAIPVLIVGLIAGAIMGTAVEHEAAGAPEHYPAAAALGPVAALRRRLPFTAPLFGQWMAA